MPANNWARLAEREQIHQEIGFTNRNVIIGFGGSPGYNTFPYQSQRYTKYIYFKI